MKVIVMLDDNNGMSFNRRRQTRDSELSRRLPLPPKGGKLWMSRYSITIARGDMHARAVYDEQMLDKAGEDDFCLVENLPLAPYADRIDTVYVARWNRVYPSDRKLDLDLTGWRETLIDEFRGSSHERITIFRYDRP